MKKQTLLSLALAAAMTAGAATAALAYDHEAIENSGDITITMMVSGTAYEMQLICKGLIFLITVAASVIWQKKG